ncbi:MAG: polysaccharide biosynthesis C-terminal domain-containing protein, partial [Ruminococcus sp.]|nr:polysaccharide biosynthesis C-terminal domain-containing protein [Ruminococcus sp.]
IPEWGIQGACIATFLSYYLCFWSRMIDARYYVPFKFDPVKSCINTTVLLLMCWVMIAKLPLYGLWLFIMLAFELAVNYKALIITVRKITGKNEA